MYTAGTPTWDLPPFGMWSVTEHRYAVPYSPASHSLAHR